MPGLCPLCKQHPLVNQRDPATTYSEVNCERCGKYWMTGEVPEWCEDNYRSETWKLGAYVKDKTLQGFAVVLFTSQKEIPTSAPAGSVGLDQVRDSFPSSVAERIDRVLLNLERKTNHLGEQIPLDDKSLPMFFARNQAEILFMLRQFQEEGFVTGYNSTFPCNIILTGKAFNRVADLKRGLFGSLSQQAFVAMKFEKSLDEAWSKGLKLGIEDCGYTALRVDAKEHNEKICDAIIAEIRKSKFLVADFTGHRNGVYFEAGLMMGIGRPVIFTCHKDDLSKAHFDTRQYNHIEWETPSELREKLSRRIQATVTP
jgi:nucleoside 2-deoxyribosyltransferase